MFLNSKRLIVLAAMACEFGCNGVSWPSERHIDSLRVLGVKSEPASLRPGQSGHVSLVCANGNTGNAADPTCDFDKIDVAWFADCNNPVNNDPTKCLNHYGAWVNQFASPLANTPESTLVGQFKVAPEFDFLAPAGVLPGEITISGQTVHYVVSYIFFAACDGNLYPRSGVSDQLPVECHDRDTGAILDQRRFVVGVTTVYSYDTVVNHNPELSDPRLDYPSISYDPSVLSQPCSVDGDCGRTDFGCPNAAGSTATSATCAPIVAPCTAGNNASCGGHCIDFQVTPESFKMTTIGGAPISNPVKSLWAEYYTNAGKLPDDARFGLPFPGDQTERSSCIPWQAPTYATEQARVWIVVRDDRGGLASLEQRILVR